MDIQVTGTIHGTSIELDAPTELAEGQRVEITVVPLSAPSKSWGDGLRQAAGVMADNPDFEQVMADVQQMRRRKREAC
jgi:hypothetical protein